MWFSYYAIMKLKRMEVEKIFFSSPERNACLLVKTPGVCHRHLLRFYYDAVHEKCKKFFFSGCGGNGNRFSTSDTCMATCTGIKREGRSKCITILTATALKMKYAKMWGGKKYY